jgi:hypothetical protein
MVVVHGFDVRLVDAFTNNPFPLHEGLDGKVYVEVEPDAEYFVVVRKVHTTASTQVVLVDHIVDGKEIPGSAIFQYREALGTERKLGSRQYHADGTCTQLSFRFMKPPVDPSLAKSSSSSSAAAAVTSMGNVEVRFFEGSALVPTVPMMSIAAAAAIPKFNLSSISSAEALDKKKAIRSGEGTNTSSNQLSGSYSSQKNALLGTGT